MSEESAYPVMSAEVQEGSTVSNDGVPDLSGLFPSLTQDQEPFCSLPRICHCLSLRWEQQNLQVR